MRIAWHLNERQRQLILGALHEQSSTARINANNHHLQDATRERFAKLAEELHALTGLCENDQLPPQEQQELYEERELLIGRIAAAARQPCPPIAPTLHGGFAYLSRDGATYGKRHASREAAARAWETSQDENAHGFREQLRAMTEARLGEQAAYWLKGETHA